jgi:hypothetical protein
MISPTFETQQVSGTTSIVNGRESGATITRLGPRASFRAEYAPTSPSRKPVLMAWLEL